MEFNKPVSNPMLVGAIEVMKAENTPEHRNMVINEAMKAQFLTPVVITPQPETDKDGNVRLTSEHRMQFPMLTAPDGKHFFMAYTDKTELKKWKDEEGQQTFAMTFDDYAGMLFKKDAQGNSSPAAGFVINAFGGNIVITKEMAASLMAAKLSKNGQNPAGEKRPE